MGSTMENVSLSIWGQWKPWSDCTSVQSDQGLHYPLTKSSNTTECMNGEQKPGYCSCTLVGWSESVQFVHVQWHFFCLTWPIWTVPCMKVSTYAYSKDTISLQKHWILQNLLAYYRDPEENVGRKVDRNLKKCISVNGDSSFEKVK